jgi:hypothetical protein
MSVGWQKCGFVCDVSSNAMRSAIADALEDVRRDWRAGRHYGYPVCCIAVYCWDRIWSLPPALTRCASQGVDPPQSDCDWVPCGILHHGGSPLTLRQRLRRILGYWWAILHPASPMWRRREGAPLVPRPPYVPLRSVAAELAEWKLVAAPGPLEKAFAQIGAQAYDPDLTWH